MFHLSLLFFSLFHTFSPIFMKISPPFRSLLREFLTMGLSSLYSYKNKLFSAHFHRISAETLHSRLHHIILTESSKSLASIAQSNKQREVLGAFIGQFQKPAKSGTGRVFGKGGFYGTHTARYQTDRHIHTAASSDVDYAPSRECTGSDED